MKVLLVNTPIDRADILGEFDSIYADLIMVPIGLAYLATSLREAGHEVRILDQYAECLSLREIFGLVQDFRPGLIGYGATTPNYHSAIGLLREVRATFPEIKTVMGGQHPSIFPELVLHNREVDFVLRDEAEHSLVELVQALQTGSELDQVEGLSFRDSEGRIIHNPAVASVDLDSLGRPAYDLLPMDRYSSPSYTRFAQPVFQMIASRGCPNSCTYCINAELNIAARYRRRPVEDVLDEMEMLQEKFGAKQIQFWDPIFPLGKAHALEFCAKLRDRGLHRKIVWNSTTYPEFLDDEIISAMAGAGCKGIGFGIESGVEELLRSVNKKTSLEKVVRVCRSARKAGMVVMGAFILGFPGETREMTQQTIDFAKSLDLHYAQFSLMVPYPGTPLYKQLVEAGEVVPTTREADFVRYNQSVGLTDREPIYIPAGRTATELKEFQKKAYTQFYFRPKVVWMHLPHVRPEMIRRMLVSFLAVVKLKLGRLVGGNQDRFRKTAERAG